MDSSRNSNDLPPGAPRCGKCGAALPADVHGVCAACLLRTALDPADLPVDDAFGNYEPLAVLGEGGMGVVYLAEQTAPLRRMVALKVLKAGAAAGAAQERFERERQSLARMDHPHIATIYDAGSSRRGVPYFAMEYLEGSPLTMYCDEARLGIDARLQLFLQVCQAVDHAHQRGILHRDIKPGNVFVVEGSGQARVKVIDFGLARLQDWHTFGRGDLTGAAQIVGTPEYMSPEQAAGPEAKVGPAADVYSLGVLLYELLTGVLPLEAAQWGDRGVGAILHAILECEIPSMTQRCARLPESEGEAIARARNCRWPELRRLLTGDLDAIVAKAVEKDAGRRYPSAREFAEDLERYRRQEPVTARRVGVPDRLRKWYRRRRGLVWTGVAAAVAAAIAAGVVARRGPVPPRVASVVPYTSAEGTESMPTFSPDGRSLAYVWDGPDGENHDLYLVSSPGATPRRLTTAPEQDLSPAWSPGGGEIAFLRAAGGSIGRLMLLDLATGKERELTRLRAWHTPTTRNLAWSPDGKWLVVLHQATGRKFAHPYFYSPATGEMRPAANLPDDAEYIHPNFSPDGRRLLIVRDDRSSDHLLQQDLTPDLRPSGAPVRISPMTYSLYPSMLPSGAVIFQSPGSARRRIWRIQEPGTPPEPLEQLGEGVASFALSKDGNRIAITRRVLDIDLVHYRQAADGSWQAPVAVAGSMSEDSGPDVSPDGSRVAFVSNRSGERQIWVAGLNDREVRQLKATDDISRGPHWLRDGRTLRFGRRKGQERSVFLVDTTSGGVPRFERGDRYVHHESADGKMTFFFAGVGNKERLYRLPSSPAAKEAPATEGPAFHSAIDPNTQWLYSINKAGGDAAVLTRVPAAGGRSAEVLAENVMTIDLGASADGVYFARKLAGRRYGVYLYRTKTGREELLFETGRRPFRRISASADGRNLVIDVAKTDGMHITVTDMANW